MFAKIFEQIFDSSIAEDYQVRHCFEDLLKLADADGAVDMTLDAIQRRTNMPLDLWKRAIVALESPDPQSRSKEHEGRRLIRIDSHRDWGWIIVNYRHYRELRDEEARKSYFRDYQRRRRGSKLVNQESPNVKYSHQMSPDLTKCSSVSTQAEAEAEAEAEGTQKTQSNLPVARFRPPSEEEANLHATKIGLPPAEIQKWRAYYESNGWKVGRNKMKSWQAAMVNWKLNYEQYNHTRGASGGLRAPQRASRTVGTANEGRSDDYGRGMPNVFLADLPSDS